MVQYYFVTTSTEGEKKEHFFIIAESVEEARNKVPLNAGKKIKSIVLFGGLSLEHRRWRGELNDDCNK